MDKTTFVMVPENEYKNLLQKVDSIFNSIVKKTQEPISEHISKNEVLFMLGISRGTYWRWVKDGKLKEYGIGAKRYCKRSEIQELLK